MTGLKTLLDGLVVGESPRWHDGRLWFCNWGAQEIRTVDVDGNSEVVAKGPKPAGFCIDFLPDGRLLVTGEDRLLRRNPTDRLSLTPTSRHSARVGTKSRSTAGATSTSTTSVSASARRISGRGRSRW